MGSTHGRLGLHRLSVLAKIMLNDAIVPVEPGKSGAPLTAKIRLRVVAASFALVMVACILLAIRVPQRERERLGEELLISKLT
jgi:hypothetical protein